MDVLTTKNFGGASSIPPEVEKEPGGYTFRLISQPMAKQSVVTAGEFGG
jgi:hypothetical protein